jgi:thiol-disulfide isomerase/thioredoxin
MMMEKGDAMMKEGEEMMNEGESMMKEGEEIMKEGESMMEKDESMMKTDDAMMGASSYEGEMLGGSSAPLLDFTKADYEKALESDKLIALYFYANWCPVCRAEFPVMQEVFNELQSDEVIGFRVNYNDNETDDYERGLAKQFGVAYQHTKVFVRNGTRILKSPEGWDKARYESEITKVLP